MKIRILLLAIVASSQAKSVSAQSTVFTYQGALRGSNGVPITGSYDFTFSLHTAATGGDLVAPTQTNSGVTVVEGLVTTTLDFGNVFDGSRYWLEIGLRTNGSTEDFQILTPRQEITATPYALFSDAVNSAGIQGTLMDSQLSSNIARLDTNAIFTGAVQLLNASNAFAGQFSGDGRSLSNLNAANLQGNLSTANPLVRGAIQYAPDILSVTEYVTKDPSSAPIAGLVRRCLYAPYDAWHLTNWCVILRSAITLEGEYARALEPAGAPTDMPTEFVFGLDGDSCVIYLRGNGSYMGIEVDGADDGSRIFTAPDGDFHFYTVTFPSRAPRQIALKLGANYHFGGVYIAPTNGMWPGILPKKERMIVVGDSFTEDSGSTGWTSDLMSLFRNIDVWASAVGSTGYLNPGTTGRTNFTGRLATDVIANNPDYVLFAGGINDSQWTTNASGSNAFYSACLTSYTTVQSSLPACKIVVLGPFWPGTPPADHNHPIYVVNGAISNACQTAGIGASYVDTLADPWVTGTWNAPGSGNAVVYTSNDGTHPTAAGQWNLAYHVASELAKRFPELQLRSNLR